MRLEAENIAVSIAGKSIVKQVTLDVPEHKFSALLGANGSGKTTLLRAIYKTQKTDSGTVRLDGEDITRFSGKKSRAAWRSWGSSIRLILTIRSWTLR